MSDESRVEQRDQLLTSLGMLVGPIQRAVFGEDDPAPIVPYLRSQYQDDLRQFQPQVSAFCRAGKHVFDAEFNEIMETILRFGEILDMLKHSNKEYVQFHFGGYLDAAQKAIRSVPCADPDTIMPAESPLKTYNRLRSICRGASNRVQLFDPYLDAEPFHRYLVEVNEKVQITVVTSKKIMGAPSGPKAVSRRDRIVAISELFAAERPSSYRFLVTSKQHDRHVRVDEDIFHLGGSIKDAAVEDPYTIANLDPTQSNHAFLDDVITNSTEWFGPNVTPHRRT